ncbi:molybdate ABC transporter substrate-binding protein [Cognatiyoonia sp. IB215446]|uniref:molybdate ABC transporter substrate-binding protein n=1 Tax=Cognatiyoonia sp. IB215446 TaxID=3097355 RepID=UPI002A166CF7|nr:molybdate ABC transporter substrate-binding protein [Cognatiyoonia sp. IB215446]MDX8347311.1 molybdate ABC transporter substrate-binding protein [Cognatiyoonia sp. IB215446]
MIWRFVLLIWLGLSGAMVRADVLVFAAASLKEPVDAIAVSLDDVVVSYGGSGTMARQVSLGAPVDVVLLANKDWMDVLVEGGHVVPASVIDFASNRLVLIGDAQEDVLALEAGDLLQALDGGRMALGLTEAVPAGIYAKSALQSLDLWEALSDRLAEVDNVRAALTLVARGQAPLGIVYATDLRITDAVRQLAIFPSDSHPPIRYQAALTRNADPAAQAFLDTLTGPEGREKLAASGFLPPLAVGE